MNTEMTPAAEPVPSFRDGLIGAACTLDSEAMRDRLVAWRQLRDRATSVEEMQGGMRLALPADEPIDDVIRLVAAESECCSFYRFTVTVDAGGRFLEIDAGTNGGPAVHALLGLGR